MGKPSLPTAAIATSLLLGTGVAVHDVSSHRSPAHETSHPVTEADQREPAPSIYAEGPCGVIGRFFADRDALLAGPPHPSDTGKVVVSKDGTLKAVESPAESLEISRNCSQPADGRHAVHYLIATIPHPTLTRLGMIFDRYAETILAAAGNAGYAFHAYWLPWADDQTGGSGSTESRREPEARKSRDRLPGILLFRGPPGQTNPDSGIPLAILLVPESPTAGVNETALHAALKIIPDSDVPVVGPCFSGSFWSLKKIFGQYTKQYAKQYAKQFHVITGSATVVAEWNSFPGQNIEFASTVYHDEYSVGKLLRMIHDEWDESARVAIISESGTRYGQSGRTVPGTNSGSDDSDAVNSLLKYALTFPREISQLRNAYSEHPELTAPAGNVNTGPAASLLPLELRDLRSGRDTVPLFARTQTPISQEAALQNIARALKTRHIEYAILTATDPLDVIFLARYLRNTCPDIRILTLGADVLYARAALEDPLTGTVSATTYPMFPEGWTRLWIKGSTQNYIPFPSVEAEGIYNAMAMLLQSSHYVTEAKLEDYRRPFCSDKTNGCAAYGAPKALLWPQESGSTAPALWLTVLSRTGYWPVGVIGASGSSLRKNLYPPTFYSISCLALVCLFTALLWRVLRPCSSRQDAVLQSSAISTAVAASVVLAGPFLVNAGIGSPAVVLLSGMSLCAGLAATASALEKPRIESRVRFSILWLPAGLMTLFSLSYLSLFLPKERLEHIFFAFRSLSLLSGVSPVAPLLLLLLAIFWWALAHLARFRSAEKWDSRVHAEALLRCLGLRTDHIQPFMKEAFPSTDQWRFGLVCVVVLFSLFAGTYESIRAIEPRPYNEIFSATLAFTLTASVMAAYRFIRIWLEMRKLLAKLESMPIRDAFATIGCGRCWSLLFSGPKSEFPIHRYISLARQIRYSPEYQHCTAVFRQIVNLMAERRGDAEQSTMDEDKVTVTVQVAKAEVYESVDERGFSRPAKSKADAEEARPDSLVEEGRKLETATMEFVALPAYEFIVYVLGQMRGLLFFFSGSFVLAAVSLMAYPFSGSGLIADALVVSFLLVGGVVTWVLAEIDRNPILSRINGTDPGKLGFEFIQAVVVFGLLPLVTVLAAYFPEFGRLLTSFASRASAAYSEH